jgi:hypothetical protein
MRSGFVFPRRGDRHSKNSSWVKVGAGGVSSCTREGYQMGRYRQGNRRHRRISGLGFEGEWGRLSPVVPREDSAPDGAWDASWPGNYIDVAPTALWAGRDLPDLDANVAGAPHQLKTESEDHVGASARCPAAFRAGKNRGWRFPGAALGALPRAVMSRAYSP